jgi:exodeoxyribonuclease VII small subunit
MSDAPEPSFEEAVAQLEQIVRELEGGESGLEQSLARYEEGVALLKRCYGQLRQAEQKIMLLTGEEGGVPALRPFEHTASIEEKRGELARRRGPRKAELDGD